MARPRPIEEAPTDGTPVAALAGLWGIYGTFKTRFENGRWVFHQPGTTGDGSPYDPLFKEWVPVEMGWKPMVGRTSITIDPGV